MHWSCSPYVSVFCPTGTFDYTFLWTRVAVHLTAAFPLWVILARASCWAELQLFNIVWNLAIRTPLRGPSTVSPHGNRCTNSQQARPFPMIMNENVQHVSIHLSDTLWWLIKPQKCVVWQRLHPGCCNLYLDVLAPQGTGLKEILAATPYQTCRHGHNDKGLWFR